MNYKQLKTTIQKHDNLYYDLATPEISDAEYDKLYQLLEELEEKQGFADLDSPTNKVGGTAGKIKHKFSLYSLRKVYNKEEIDNSFDVETPKIDGANITAYYTNGKLTALLTRGNGELGNNILHLAKFIKGLPLEVVKVDLYPFFAITGECVTDNEVENFRNYVAGALNMKTAEHFKLKNIRFIAHDLFNVELDYLDRLKFLSILEITTVLSKNEIAKYPTDGLVYRINSIKEEKRLGYTSKYPRFAVALKEREALTATTTLKDVVWTIGRTGVVTPVGIVEPVSVDDATISRVTLHNIEQIEVNNIGIGDIISIERAGGVIPKFVEVITKASNALLPDQNHAEIQLKEKLKRVGPKLFVIDNSKFNYEKQIEYFVKNMQIKGLGPSYIKRLGIKTINDLYSNKIIPKLEEIGVNGQKIAKEIELSKSKPYYYVLAAIGIPGIGLSMAKKIVKYIPDFTRLKDIEYYNIEGIGEKRVEQILSWLYVNEEWVLELPLQLRIDLDIIEEPVETNGKKICITGKLDMSRNDLKEILEKHGYIVTNTVTKDTYILITDGETEGSKYKNAINKNIPIMDYWKFKSNILKGDINIKYLI